MGAAPSCHVELCLRHDKEAQHLILPAPTLAGGCGWPEISSDATRNTPKAFQCDKKGQHLLATTKTIRRVASFMYLEY